MKFKYRAIILALIFGFFTAPTFAQDCDLTGMPSDISDIDKQKLRVQCEQMILEAKQAPQNALNEVAGDLSNPEALSAWGTVAQEWAKALGIAATELGLAVDTFLDTDAGKLTAVVIIWTVMGDSILGFLFGVPLLIAVITIGLRTAKRLRIESIEYGEGRTWRGARVVEKITYKSRFSDSEGTGIWLSYIATVVLSTMVISLVIF